MVNDPRMESIYSKNHALMKNYNRDPTGHQLNSERRSPSDPQNRMSTTCRDAIKAFATNQYRNKVGEKPEEAAHVRLYGMLPPITKMDPAALSTLKECKHLALSSNNIDKIGNLAGMEKLVILSLGRNNIKKLENLDGLGSHKIQLNRCA